MGWKSNNSSVATVSRGVVTGIAKGDTEVEMWSQVNSTLKDKCTIRVRSASHIDPMSVFLTGKPTPISVGYEAGTSAQVYPTNATDKSVEYTNSNPEVCSIVPSGSLRMIRGLKAGKSVISVYCKDKPSVRDSFEVTIKDYVHVTEIQVQDITLYKGQTAPITHYVIPEHSTDKSIQWDVAHTNIASVSNNNITGKIEGTTHIVSTAIGSLNQTVQKTVNVNVLAAPVPVTGVTLAPIEFFRVGQRVMPNYKVLPENASNKSVTITSSNLGVAYVEKDNQITAAGVGNATITVTTTEGSFTATQNVVCEVGYFKFTKPSMQVLYNFEFVVNIDTNQRLDESQVAWFIENDNVIQTGTHAKGAYFRSKTTTGYNTIKAVNLHTGTMATLEVLVHQEGEA